MRTLVFGNGQMFVGIDQQGLIRELCWPTVGAPNHLAGRPIRLGIRRGEWFSWLGSEGWTVENWLAGESGVTEWKGFGFVVQRVCGLNGRLFDQTFEVTGGDGQIRIYQSQCLRINETDIMDTALYHLDTESIIHFKQNVCLSFVGRGSTGHLDAVSCGLAETPNHTGTWLEAESDALSGKPIEQGCVDSTFAIDVQIHEGVGHFELPIVAGRIPEECSLTFGNRMAGQGRTLEDFSIHVVESHALPSGPVVAAIDSDIMGENRSNYAQVWMRDAVLTARGLGRTESLLSFLPPAEDGRWIWQKYHPLGYRGSTWHPFAGDDPFPYQMDETALLVQYECENLAGDDRTEARLDKWVRLLLNAIDDSGLPRPSWDLWEERFGVHLWTVSTVIEALRAAEPVRGAKCTDTANRMVEATLKFFQPVDGRIPRRLTKHPHGYEADLTADSSVIAACLHSEPLADVLLDAAVELAESHLLDKCPAGGVARYAGDYYGRVREGYPGNPWIICTAWLARAYFRQGRIGKARQLLKWIESRASSSGMLAEQVHPDSGEPAGVCPLVWSHAEYLETLWFVGPD